MTPDFKDPATLRSALQGSSWDACVIGNGASALWTVKALQVQGRSVLWVTSEEPCTLARATSKHGWYWAATAATAETLAETLGLSQQGPATVEAETVVAAASSTADSASVLSAEDSGSVAGAASSTKDSGSSAADPSGATVSPAPFEAVYFDARSTKRFRRITEAKPEWGTHEVPLVSSFFESLKTTPLVDLSRLHTKVLETFPAFAAPSSGDAVLPPFLVLNQEPRVIMVRTSLLLELKISTDANPRIESLEFAFDDEEGKAATTATSVMVHATKFILGDFDEYFPSLVRQHEAAQRLSVPLKGRHLRAGFSLGFVHGNLESPLPQFQVIPLVASVTKKGTGSHVMGRFMMSDVGAEIRSAWFGLLTDEELEDNNEILKKIKSAKRVLERTLPGFSESILRESVTFEPLMCARGDGSKKPNSTGQALGALFVTDAFGPEGAAAGVALAVQSRSKETRSGHRKASADEARPEIKELDHGNKVRSQSHLRGADQQE